MSDKILKSVGDYYSNKIKEFGNTPNGVDWNSKESQYIRFEQLCNVINKDEFSVLDYGCGYGELINFLYQNSYSNFNYTGLDVSKEMIDAAKSLFKDRDRISFTTQVEESKFDYVIASGIFNVRASHSSEEEWLAYILHTLDRMNALGNHGFSFNVLTKYSDKEYMKEYLYYADPCFLFDHCKKNYSKNVAVLHDYDLYEFTIIVRK